VLSRIVGQHAQSQSAGGQRVQERREPESDERAQVLEGTLHHPFVDDISDRLNVHAGSIGSTGELKLVKQQTLRFSEGPKFLTYAAKRREDSGEASSRSERA